MNKQYYRLGADTKVTPCLRRDSNPHLIIQHEIQGKDVTITTHFKGYCKKGSGRVFSLMVTGRVGLLASQATSSLTEATKLHDKVLLKLKPPPKKEAEEVYSSRRLVEDKGDEPVETSDFQPRWLGGE